MAKIAFLGLGAMGSRMAQRLLDAGHEVTVWNRSPVRAELLRSNGAKLAETPATAVKDAEFVFAMVRDDEASRQIWTDPSTGALETLSPSAIAVECSTLSPAWMQTLAETAGEKTILDAPVAGSRPQVEAGALQFLIGGQSEHLDQLRPVLAPMAGGIHHAGDQVGQGMALKLVVNALFGVQVAAVAELLSLADKLGLAIDQTIETLGALPITSPAAKMAMGAMATNAFDPLFPIDLVEKDFSLVLGSAGDLPIAAAAKEVYAKAKAAGFAGENLTAVAKLYR